MAKTATFISRLKRAGRGSPAHRARVAALCAVTLSAASTLGGCASQPKPVAQLVRANTLVGQAEKDEAQRYAAADLQRARDELGSAQTAAADGKYDHARTFADKAAVDADLASARASSGKAQQSAEQVHRSLNTLREQLQQNPAPSANPDPGASGPGPDPL
ncbi:MAG TPA: DUF4398 domain-containing protein [Steroidobacteraceae bacterium]|nr:DUF4398 domain-containing protein [Steroidobacteraceae bacterium]